MLGKLNEEQIEYVLTSNVIGRIGCYHNARVYVVPVTYYYDGKHIIGHTTEGMKIEILRKNPICCFEVDKIDNLANWQSVITWGRFEELKGEKAKEAMKRLVDHLMPVMVSQTSQPSHGLHQSHQHDTEGKTPIIYQIKLTEKTGRFEKR